MKSCPVSRPVPAGNPLSRPEKSGHQKVGKLDTLVMSLYTSTYTHMHTSRIHAMYTRHVYTHAYTHAKQRKS